MVAQTRLSIVILDPGQFTGMATNAFLPAAQRLSLIVEIVVGVGVTFFQFSLFLVCFRRLLLFSHLAIVSSFSLH